MPGPPRPCRPAGIVVVGRELVVAGAAVEQVGAAVALEVVVAVLAVELAAVPGRMVVDRAAEVVAVPEQHEKCGFGPAVSQRAPSAVSYSQGAYRGDLGVAV